MKLLFWNVNLIDNETAIEDQVAQATERAARKVGAVAKNTYGVGKSAVRGFGKGLGALRNGPTARELELMDRLAEYENNK